MNFVVMFIGELFVTDGIVAYASHVSNRYCVDLPVAWKDTNTSRRHRIWYFLIIMSIYACIPPISIQSSI